MFRANFKVHICMSHFFRKALWHNDKQMKNIPPLLDTKQISAICSSFFDAAPAAAAVSRAWEHIGQGQFSSPLALGWRGNSGDFRAGERSRNFRYRLSSSSPSPSPGKLGCELFCVIVWGTGVMLKILLAPLPVSSIL